MCGLAGRFHPYALPDAPAWRERVDALLAHRGPDGGGCFHDGRCELVHRRLALLDLRPSGAQPMASEDGEVRVVFNGEIYNHRPLRRMLEDRGHVFRSTADTEVLVHLYEECGETMVHGLRGIFAFAIYDRRRARLLLARDRYGVKPLFYTSAAPDGQWVFASELKAIAALPGLRLEVDRQACYDFLGLGYVPEPATGFAHIQALPPGTVLCVGPSGARLMRYHRVQARPDGARQLQHAADAAASSLSAAAVSQSRADVPVAALLSGGLDSSLVVAAAVRSAGTVDATFNIRFPEAAYDETPLARQVARQCGTDHHTIDAGERLAPDAVFDLMRHFDQPFADTSFLPMYWVAAGVRDRGVVCALSGDGGDEVFGGYAHFWRAHRLMALTRLPAWMRRAVHGVGGALRPWTRDLGRQVAKASAYAEAGAASSRALLALMHSYLGEDQKRALVCPGARVGMQPAARLFGDDGSPVSDLEEFSRRLTEALFTVSLPSDMLRKVDMMSMRASIEVRVPMLDDDVVAVGLSLPHRLKTDGRQGKLALRALARAWLPTEVAAHPKHGFSIPLDVMLPGTFHDAAADLLMGAATRTRPVLRAPTVAAWLAAARRGRAGGAVSREGATRRVFTLLALELWLREFGLTW